MPRSIGYVARQSATEPFPRVRRGVELSRLHWAPMHAHADDLRQSRGPWFSAVVPLIIAAVFVGWPGAATAQVLPSFPSVTVHSDHSITFRYRDPGATAVLCSVENVPKSLEMKKDAEGIWTATTEPLPPELPVSFEIDGISFLDPANPWISNSQMRPANMLEIPGDGPQLWDAIDVPHGEVHHDFYTTT